ncbi:MAG: hypothetical protein QM578_12510 [Pantoea sp.]|uniref:hypothetical protein n=1 Tax=Pantoea sp. TaxID=69393 RepID=UPI0039E70A7C
MLRHSEATIYSLVQYPRQSDIRRVWCRGKKTITPSQRVWTRYLLMLWGKHLGGEEYFGGCGSVIGQMMLRTEWSQQRSDEIIHAVNMLHEQGYRGDELFKRSREMVIPGTTAASLIALAKESDDAAFVERVISKTFIRTSPIRDIGIMRYCERKNAQEIARDIAWVNSCDVQLARKRVIWCEQILEEEMFYAVKREMEKERDLIAA